MIRFHVIDEDLKTRATTVLLNDSIDYNNLKMDLPYIGFVEKACAKLNAHVEQFKQQYEENKKFVRIKINKLFEMMGESDDDSRPNTQRALKSQETQRIPPVLLAEIEENMKKMILALELDVKELAKKL